MSGLRLGLQLNVQFLPEEVRPDQRFAELVEQVELAREVGFSAIGVPHHHSIGDSVWLHPLLVLARLAQHSGEMEVATTVYLMGHYHPLEVAEQIATLDAMCGGRLRFGVSTGWAKVEFETLGLPYERRMSRFVEALQVMKQLWSGETVNHSGEHFHLNGVRLAQRPLQRPHPPIWMGASVAKAAERAARLGDAFLISAHPRISDMEPVVAAYRSALASLGKPEPPGLPIVRNCYVGETLEQAVHDVAPSLEEDYRVYAKWNLLGGVLGDNNLNNALLSTSDRRTAVENLCQDRVLLGDPEDVAEQFLSLQRRLGVGLAFLRIPRLGLSHKKALRCIELLGREVLPRIAKSGAGEQQEG